MAICNFRADAFGLASGETIDLEKLVEFLEMAREEGLAKKDLEPEWTVLFISLKSRGLVSEKQGIYHLNKQGMELLNTCSAILQQGPETKVDIPF